MAEVKTNPLFTGPIFIVGMPRSGTKLLRDILNNNSQISIPTAETQFIPHIYLNFHQYGNLTEKRNFDRFYHDIERTTFFSYVDQATNIWDKDRWYNSIEEFSCSGVLTAFFRIHAEKKGKRIWGDKTPTYIKHLPILIELFPSAKFIHIIRDVRDFCLSNRKTWGKNIYRAADRWVSWITKCRIDEHRVAQTAYKEVKYEELLGDPEHVIKELCDFLGIEFEPEMIFLKQPSENLGDTKGVSEIVRFNFGKWENELTELEIKNIEAIAGSMMEALGYKAVSLAGQKKISSLKMFYYHALDIYHMLIFRWKETGGIAAALKWISRQKATRVK